MTEGAPCSFKCKQELQGRKRQGAKLTEKWTRGAPCSFKCKQGLQGRKLQGRQIEKRPRGASCRVYAVSSRGSREENVMGAKLTEKRTRGAPCSFKCTQGLQGRKRQGCQIDGEKDKTGAMQFQVHAGAPGKKTSGRQIDGEKDERVAMQFQVEAGALGKKTSETPNWRRKGREMRHAVSSASMGSSKKQRQGRQIDGEKDERGAMQFQV